ncbi:protein TEX261-like [Watersipora subatra]|uniref:protein TEX261-like n=1 Tax=Watersipora subatra TaxID=2589382 RepID=UPI00355B3F2D
MWFMWLLSWVAMLIQLVLLTLAIATGLYYLAELVEEYTSASARALKYMIYATVAVYVGFLLFEDLPLSFVLAGIIQQVFHLMLLQTFPHFTFTSLAFIGTCVLLAATHYLAFTHFSVNWYPFPEVLAVFTICLWLVPFGFFVSLSANDNTLPSTVPAESSGLLNNGNDDLLSSYFNRKRSKVGLLSALKSAQEYVGLTFRSKKAF